MKNVIKILGILFFINIIISCGNNENKDSIPADVEVINDIEVAIAKQEVSTIIKEFESTKNAELSYIVIHDINCNKISKYCDEILKYTSGSEVTFSSSSDLSLSEIENYEKQVHGSLKIGEETIDAILFYNLNYLNNNTIIKFDGALVFDKPQVMKSLQENKLAIHLKGIKELK